MWSFSRGRRKYTMASQEIAHMSNCVFKICYALRRLATHEEGQDLVENALVLALISMGAVALLTGIGTKVVNTLTSINNAL
jgi:Flp pilus assembly pilin Flp